MQIAGVQGAPVTGYVYDAAGTRVAKGTLSQFSCNYAITTFTTSNSYVLVTCPQIRNHTGVCAVPGGKSG